MSVKFNCLVINYLCNLCEFRNVDAAERRKQMIQESKFLGGDMEHTHLVKGLDYALLQKVCFKLQDEVALPILVLLSNTSISPTRPKSVCILSFNFDYDYSPKGSQ